MSRKRERSVSFSNNTPPRDSNHSTEMIPDIDAPTDTMAHTNTYADSNVDASDEGSPTLGSFLWSEVSVSLHVFVLRSLHYACGRAAMESIPSRRVAHLVSAISLAESLISREPLNPSTITAFLSPLLAALSTRLSAIATSSHYLTSGARCVAFLRALESAGFGEDDGTAGEEAQLHAAVRRTAELHGYSYSVRSAFVLPVLPRYDGDRRAEAQHRQLRLGRVVQLPWPHPHTEVNTSVQLIEPRRRRPPLDENRIFSHPKRATASAAEDLLVDEELQFRGLVVLARQLDACGSLNDLSPFVRFLLWGLVERDEELFERLTAVDAGDGDVAIQQQQLLIALRRRVAARRSAFDATREAAREAARRVGWYAASAHWRDQVLRHVEDAEDADWCLLRDAAKCGGRAVFPNYAASSALREFLLRALRRVRDGRVDIGAVEDPSDCYNAVVNVLLPLLEGRLPVKEETKESDEETRTETACTLSKRVAALLERPVDAKMASASRWAFDCDAFEPPSGVVVAFVSDMFVWPLQCLAALLELCAAARHSVDGLKKFSAALVSSNWGDEESLLEFLLRREPMNIPLATLVGLPRLVRDVFLSAHWLCKDKCFAAIVECWTQAASSSLTFGAWCAIDALLSEDDITDELHALTVRNTPSDTASGKLWGVAELQCTPRAWVKGLHLLISNEGRSEETVNDKIHEPI